MKKWLIAIVVIGLLIAHQDWWQWDRNDLVYGFIPRNMAWHLGLSLVTSVVWIVVCVCCWPKPDLPADADSATNDESDRK